MLDGVLDPERTVQIGIRGTAEFAWEFFYDSGMTVIHAEDVDRLGIEDVLATSRRVLGDGPIYVSVDVGLDIVGGDVVEVAPQNDATTNTAHVGAQMLFEILSMIAYDGD